MPLVGASGVVSAIMGAYLLLFPQAKVIFFFINSIFKISAKFYLILFLTSQVLYFIVMGNNSPIAYLGHLLGFLVGMVITSILMQFNQVSRIEHFLEY